MGRNGRHGFGAQYQSDKLKIATDKRNALDVSLTEKNAYIAKLSSTKKQKETVIVGLRTEKNKLRKQLSGHQKRINELDNFIQEILVREMESKKKDSQVSSYGSSPEDNVLNNKFVENKGKLPWPVKNGVIVQKFGNYRPEGLSRVSLKSNGVDFATDKESIARAVFNGKVIGVYALPGYNTGVIVKHGTYFSFYANLEEVYVNNGDEVKTKQNIGKIFSEPGTFKSVLHFEVYKDKTALNPELWLAK